MSRALCPSQPRLIRPGRIRGAALLLAAGWVHATAWGGTLTPVPEAETWEMALVGLGVIWLGAWGQKVRRRQAGRTTRAD